jgi:hypothetical protein
VLGEELGDEGLYAAESGGGERGVLVGSLFEVPYRVRYISDLLAKRSAHWLQR